MSIPWLPVFIQHIVPWILISIQYTVPIPVIACRIGNYRQNINFIQHLLQRNPILISQIPVSFAPSSIPPCFLIICFKIPGKGRKNHRTILFYGHPLLVYLLPVRQAIPVRICWSVTHKLAFKHNRIQPQAGNHMISRVRHIRHKSINIIQYSICKIIVIKK